MGRGLPMVSGRIFAALLASIMMLGTAAHADDPHEVSATPQMLPGEDINIFNAMNASARYSVAQRVANDQQVMTSPTGYSSCVTNLLQTAQTINDMFDDGFSVAGVINLFSDAGFQIMFNELQSKLCAIGGQLTTVENGMTLGGSVTNLFGTGANLKFSATIAPDPGAPMGTLPSSNAGAAGTQTADDAASQGDDLDAIANSGGASLTAMNPPATSGGTTVSNENDTPAAPTQVAMVDAGKPGYSTPQNATVCIPPDNRSWVSHNSGITDAPTSTTSTYQNNGGGDNTSLATEETATVAAAPASPVVPPAVDPPPTNGQKQAMIPAGQDASAGPIKCQGSTINASPGQVSTGTPCTAKDKVQCIAGSSGSCSMHGAVGVAKYPQNFVMGGTPFSYAGTNYGQCASLVRSLVPSLPYTGAWHQGARVQGLLDLQFGTPVATFFGPGNTYKNPPTIIQHTAIYMGQIAGSGLFILEQYHDTTGKAVPPHEALHPWVVAGRPVWTSGAGAASRQDEKAGQNYYVVN